MRTAIHSATTDVGSVATVVAEVRRAADVGLGGHWAPMLGGQDTLTAPALAGREVGGIELGTAVVPMPLRSPFALAQQVRTVQEAVGGRFVGYVEPSAAWTVARASVAKRICLVRAAR
ncbi:LLM class flavin-dependent oxidoreductase [Nocardia sp. NBC_01377]|uniref:LLM class flavin-dependent oxidoreductase n=1 Tax=Nocardia sp. NBC_01377 TaxID=2903595 RepID=UPI0032528CA5